VAPFASIVDLLAAPGTEDKPLTKAVSQGSNLLR